MKIIKYISAIKARGQVLNKYINYDSGNKSLEKAGLVIKA